MKKQERRRLEDREMKKKKENEKWKKKKENRKEMALLKTVGSDTHVNSILTK